MGHAAGIPALSQVALLLAAVSAVLGDRLGFERNGVRHAADFRLSTLSPETEPPPWLALLWQAMLETAKQSVVPPDRSTTLTCFQTETRRQLAGFKAVGLDHTFDAQVLEHSLRIKPFPGGKLARTLGPPDTRGWHAADYRPRCLVALGKAETRAALRHGMPRLAKRLAAQHFRHLRLAFPADDDGFFTAEETRVFRQLGDTPATCRDIQRKLAATTATTCRNALARATRAGVLRAVIGSGRVVAAGGIPNEAEAGLSSAGNGEAGRCRWRKPTPHTRISLALRRTVRLPPACEKTPPTGSLPRSRSPRLRGGGLRPAHDAKHRLRAADGHRRDRNGHSTDIQHHRERAPHPQSAHSR